MQLTVFEKKIRSNFLVFWDGKTQEWQSNWIIWLLWVSKDADWRKNLCFPWFLITKAPGIPKLVSTENLTWYVLVFSPLLVLVFPPLRFAWLLILPLPVPVGNNIKQKTRFGFDTCSNLLNFINYSWNVRTYLDRLLRNYIIEEKLVFQIQAVYDSVQWQFHHW